MVVPNTQYENHTRCQRLTHVSKSTVILETSSISESSLLRITVGGGNGVVSGHTGDVDFRVLDNLTVLNIQTSDFAKATARTVGARQELGDDREFLGGVDDEVGTVEAVITHTEGVEVATIGIAETSVSVGGTAVSASAHCLSLNAAWVGSIGCRDGVGFPNVHFIAARSRVTRSSIGVAS